MGEILPSSAVRMAKAAVAQVVGDRQDGGTGRVGEEALWSRQTWEHKSRRAEDLMV